jgi:beta-N-acetylhexosaminidase
VLRLPPARVLAQSADAATIEAAGRALGVELRALGFTTPLAPVLDVATRPENPVIGDRAFGDEPARVIRAALAFAAGLRAGGVFPCGKHFPGHGDTTVDSHLDLPVVEHARARLDAVELAPFRAAIAANIEALLTAHVVFPALDGSRTAATLSRAIATDLVRSELGFRGVLFSDDLEMKAVATRMAIEEAAVGAVRAGCDVLLVCSDEDAQARAFEALVHEAERDAAFRARCEEAAARAVHLRRAFPPRPARDREELARIVGPGAAAAAAARELRAALDAIVAGGAGGAGTVAGGAVRPAAARKEDA